MMQCRNNNNNALKLIIWYSSNHQSVFESINPLQWNYFLNFPKTKKYISGIFVKIKIFEKLLSEIQFQSLELFSLVEASVFFIASSESESLEDIMSASFFPSLKQNQFITVTTNFNNIFTS